MLHKLQRTMWIEGALTAVGLNFPFILCSPGEKTSRKRCPGKQMVCSGPRTLGMDEGYRLPLCRLKGLLREEPSLPRSPEGCRKSSLHIRSANPLGIAPEKERNSLHPIFFLGRLSPPRDWIRVYPPSYSLRFSDPLFKWSHNRWLICPLIQFPSVLMTLPRAPVTTQAHLNICLGALSVSLCLNSDQW